MKKVLCELLVIVIIGVILLFLFTRPGSSNKIKITNTGTGVIEVTSETNTNKMMIGPNGTYNFDRDSKIQIGNAAIKIGKHIEIVNTGSDEIQITYNDKEKSEKKLLLGENGTGYISNAKSLKIDNAIIEIN